MHCYVNGTSSLLSSSVIHCWFIRLLAKNNPDGLWSTGQLCRCWQYTNVHLCSVMGQLTKGNNIYCKTKVILTKHFTCSCWWWPSLAKTCWMNIKLIWTTSLRCANRSTVTSMHSHNTLAFACSDLFLPTTCVSQSLWSSSGRDNFHRSLLKRRHTHTHTFHWSNIRPSTDECETCQVLYVAQHNLAKETFQIKVYTTYIFEKLWNKYRVWPYW
jgi:hypothetical protein